MHRRRYRAFLSYSTRYAAWVDVLHRNLERVFGEDSVFLDKKSIGPGESWVEALQRGVANSDHLVLIATPESFASPWVREETAAMQADVRNRLGDRSVVPVLLVDAPWPPFLRTKQHIDFREAGGARYRDRLGALIGALGGDALPDDVDEPALPVRDDLPVELREEVQRLVAEPLGKRAYRRAVATAIGANRNALENFPRTDLAANAALVLSRGDDDAASAATRLLRIVAEEYEDETPDLASRVAALRKSVADLGEGDGLLSRYRAHVEKANSRLMPYFHRDRAAADVLEHVYVELELGRDPTRRAGKLLEGELATPQQIGDLVDLDPAQHSWVTRRWALKGDPGAGKTTLLRHFAHELARTGSTRLPVYASLPRLLRERTPILEGIEHSLSRAFSAKGLTSTLDREGEEGRLVVLLDSLDEVQSDRRQDALDLIGELSRRWKDSTLIVASRPIGFTSPGADFHELRVLPLDRGRQLDFLGRWFAPPGGEPDRARAETVLARLADHPDLRALAGTPLYLTLMAILLERGVEPSPQRVTLYDQIFDLLLEGKHRGDEAVPLGPSQVVRRTLARLALGLVEDDRIGASVGELHERLLREDMDDLRKTLERQPDWSRDPRRFLDDVAERSGILGPHDGPDTDWRFWHKSFGEALCAEALEQRYRADGKEACLDLVAKIQGNEGRWAEPFALLSGRLAGPDEADDLLRSLVEQNEPLGLRALATAQRVGVDTLAETIARLRQSDEESWAVYGRVVQLVGDVERGLLLLDRLRRDTRNGAELFHIDAALAAVEANEDHAEHARALRGKVFDHIDPPPAELFTTLPTRDGERQLWCSIPAGGFRMGSEEDEAGSIDNEHPTRGVEVPAFELFAAPVTNAQYLAFDPGHPFDPGLESCPAVNVTWFEAVMFCRWLGGRLPSEAEWEYACRAETTTPYGFDGGEEELLEYGWFFRNSGEELLPADTTRDYEKVYGEWGCRSRAVAQKKPNGWGLYDMHGNVWEWCQDRWHDDYGGAPTDGSAWEEGGAVIRVFRGGSFGHAAQILRSAYRDYWDPSSGSRRVGLRPARAPRGDFTT
ncbi:MAG: SUMF1/EgtB/PvdO family nonheme iron enzyme [Planctomycetota bacterium]